MTWPRRPTNFTAAGARILRRNPTKWGVLWAQNGINYDYMGLVAYTGLFLAWLDANGGSVGVVVGAGLDRVTTWCRDHPPDSATTTATSKNKEFPNIPVSPLYVSHLL